MKTWLKPVLIGSVSNLRFIIEVPNISLPHLEAWSHIKAWSEKITFEIEAPASIRGNTVHIFFYVCGFVPSAHLGYNRNQTKGGILLMVETVVTSSQSEATCSYCG